MFPEITQQDVLNCIATSTENPFGEGIDYSIFYNGKKYSSREIINRHYIINNLINPNPKFNTNDAQGALLKLGFPVVDKEMTKPSDFFTQKDLLSFDKIVGRQQYDPTNPIDHNIAKYLAQIPWGKTEFWAKQLKSDKWDIEGRKQWNSQHSVFKQVYKQYTWYRIIPKNTTNKLVYFTVGIDRYQNRQLLVKMDIQREHEYFTDERKIFFDTELNNLGIKNQPVTFDDLPNYNWDRLVNETISFIENNIDSYFVIVEKLKNIKPIKAARICWNTNGWTSPSGPVGKSPFGSFESLAGFANDEWLFDLNSNDGGFTYARLEPIQKSRKKLAGKKIDLLLFTFERNSDNMIWIGKISNVLIVNEAESQSVHLSPIGLKWHEVRLNQLKAIQGVNSTYYEKFAPEDMYNLKYRPDDVQIFDFSSAVDVDAIRVKRYILHNISLQQAIDIISEVDDFEPSNDVDDGHDNPNSTSLPSTPTKIKKTYNSFTREYENVHKEIQRGIVQYLRGKYPKASVSFENNKEINNGFIDVVVLNEGLRTYIEIKSYPSLRACIRAALGQLIEYSFFVDTNKADRLVISSQHPCTTEVDKFLSHLRRTLNLNIYYAQFDSEIKQLVGLDFL